MDRTEEVPWVEDTINGQADGRVSTHGSQERIRADAKIKDVTH